MFARNWVSFNSNYTETANAKFDKYAKRLNEAVAPEDVASPSHILCPYTMSEAVDDPWWSVSNSLFERSVAYAPDGIDCIRVVAAKDAGQLDELLGDVADPRVAVWVSRLDELTTHSTKLEDYARAIRNADAQGKQVFALYGGFLSVLLSSIGLRGSCHGIGFGEYRDYLELPRSGPPPARYYLPTIHRYVSQELAYVLGEADPGLVNCECEVCENALPTELSYHALMRHSVLCRSIEIERFSGVNLDVAVERLESDSQEFLNRLDATASLPQQFKTQAHNSSEHLARWVNALSNLRH